MHARTEFQRNRTIHGGVIAILVVQYWIRLEGDFTLPRLSGSDNVPAINNRTMRFTLSY